MPRIYFQKDFLNSENEMTPYNSAIQMIQFHNLNLFMFNWLDLNNLEMELVDFQESADNK